MDAKTIYIYSFSRNQKFNFPAYLIDFSDNYKSAWKKESVLGKMDPIATFSNTVRTINLVFDIPCDIGESAAYFDNIQYLIEGMYPVYDEAEQGRAILASPPMFRVRFANLIRNSSYYSNDDENDPTLKSGLLCYIENFDFKPKVDSGFFILKNELYPKLISVSLVLNVIHEFPLGHKKDGNSVKPRSSFNNFPYKRNKKPPEQPVAAETPAPQPRPPGAPQTIAATSTVSDGGKGNNTGGVGRNGGKIPGKANAYLAIAGLKPKLPIMRADESFADYLKRIGRQAENSEPVRKSSNLFASSDTKSKEDSSPPPGSAVEKI